MTTIGLRQDAETTRTGTRLGSAYNVLSRQVLILPAAVSLVLYFALFLLLRGKSFRLTQTLTLYRWPQLRELSDALTPNSLVTTTWRADQAAAHEYLYALVAIGLVAVWVAALWLTRPGAHSLRLRWVLLPILLFSLPLLLVPGMFSGDLYLYMFYGRIISTYGQNPIVVPPDHFSSDLHLNWVYWKWLPSAYGPVWLMVSGALSGLAGNALFANIFTYKVAVLGVHFLTTVVVWSAVKSVRPELATWAAIFYGWNPLVLFETAGSGHNDVMVALFMGLNLMAVFNRRWLYAVFFLVAAAMVKLTTALLLPALVLAWALSVSGALARVRVMVSAAAVAALGGLALYVPLWGGSALFRNALANPAATDYQNSLWQLLLKKTVNVTDMATLLAMTHNLDLVRNLLFVAAFVYLTYRLAKDRQLIESWVWLWFAYCLSLAWIWPWYFLLVIPVAAARGPSRTTALAAGLTLGGMLFWLGWPDPPLPAAPWLHIYRSVLLFAPAVAVALWPALSRGVERALGQELSTTC